MMVLLKDSLPGSIPFLLITFVLGLILLQWQHTRRWGHWWLWGLFMVYLGFSMPVVSGLLVAPLSWGFAPLKNVEEARGAKAVVVLDGGTQRYHHSEHLLELPNGSSVLRALEAARVYRLLGRPLVIVSGGDAQWKQNWAPEASALCDALVTLGVPRKLIILDSNSQDTRAHAINLVRLLRDRGISDFVLVTSPTHMRRSVMAFRAVGADPIPSPSASIIDDVHGWKGLWPSPEALLLSEEAAHDYIGLGYYALRGWL